ncbi:hypothetical protein [Rouxiella sp. S1S-2]|uniref:hypothetical protein n=1 Tax=Rouxiella sp. S1S-2 TaxID=2653856 RepID=UPI00186AE724|nr:hypothetical protein [Rouxiella sp. S1S-2]
MLLMFIINIENAREVGANFVAIAKDLYPEQITPQTLSILQQRINTNILLLARR